MVAKVGSVAYQLYLRERSEVHLPFHISQLKNHLDDQICQADLPIVGSYGVLVKEPLFVFDRKMGKRGNRAVTKTR